MNNQFKPGDLALIVGAKNAENVGRVVELLSWHPSSEKVVSAPTGTFNNNGRSGSWLVCGDLISSNHMGLKVRDKYGVLPKEKLMPLQGDFAPERQKATEVPA